MAEPSHQRLFIDFRISTQVGVRYDEETKQWVSVCPVLDLYSQGDTEEQAICNIHEAVSLFLGTCYEIGTLNQVLQERGFHRAEGRRTDPFTIPLTADEEQRNRAPCDPSSYRLAGNNSPETSCTAISVPPISLGIDTWPS